MSWIRLSMKFPGTCIVCNGKIETNQIGLWSKGLGVKHEKCAEDKELKCSICGNVAGCSTCEYRDDCDLEKVSEICICKKCSDEKDPYSSYLVAIKKKFPFLNPQT